MLPIDYLGTTMDDRRKQCDGLLLYGLVRARAFFYWFDYADPYTTPADNIVLMT